jgi:membrane fusion protein, heavy metal efflux system
MKNNSTHSYILNKMTNTIKSVSFICALWVAASCGPKEEVASKDVVVENTVALSAAQLKNASISLGKIEQKSISSVLKVNGRIDVPPQNMISISVPMGGYLKSTSLLPGMHLNKGEVIATMEDQQYIQLQQDYLTAKARLNFSASEYQRQKELNISKATSDKVFQQTETDYLTEKINVKSLAERLKLIGINPDKLDENTISKSINIYSPINGYVSKINVNVGKFTLPSEVLFELINPADIHLALTVFERDLEKLSIGQKVFAYTNSQPDKKHECEIILIGKNLSEERSTEVHSHFEDYDKSLVPGMYMNADIEIQNNNAYALPEEAVVRFENNQYIFLADKEGTYSIQEVKTGSTENGFIEIIEGEKLVDKNIIIKGAYTLLMTMKNKVEE